MRFYHFKGGDDFNFDAHIFGRTPERACELFLIYLLLNEQRDDQMLWREVDPNEFGGPDRARLCQTLSLDVEGVASHDPERGWWPVPPHIHSHEGNE